MTICTTCGAILKPEEVDAHNKITKTEHDDNVTKIQANQATTLGMKK